MMMMMMNEPRAVTGMKIGKETEVIEETYPISLSPPKISHDLT
jgi:hypothetical protein